MAAFSPFYKIHLQGNERKFRDEKPWRQHFQLNHHADALSILGCIGIDAPSRSSSSGWHY